MKPRVGQYLYASCSAQNYGRILSVGEDGNGFPVMDIEVFHPSDLLSFGDDPSDPKPGEFHNPLTGIRITGENVRVILTDVQWRMSPLADAESLGIVCNTPGDGCYRCTKLFTLRTDVGWQS